MPKVFVLYYSTYGHVQTLSRHIRKGLESQGVEVETYQVINNDPLLIINQTLLTLSTRVGARDLVRRYPWKDACSSQIWWSCHYCWKASRSWWLYAWYPYSLWYHARYVNTMIWFSHDSNLEHMIAQWKSFLDATGQLWASGALAGKFAGIFFSTASQHG